MKFFKKMKDGGPESTVTGYWLVEIKSLFSIALMKFEGKSREAFHTHAFNSINWVVKGHLVERNIDRYWIHRNASWKPFVITRDDFHKVDSFQDTSWVLSFRGPWAKTWKEYLPNEDRYRTLSSGRVEV
jgi:hypothetical protein